MKKYIRVLICFIGSATLYAIAAHEVNESCATIMMSASHVNATPMKLFVGIIDKKQNAHEKSQNFLSDFKRCIDWSGRFTLKVAHLEHEPTKKSEIQALFKNEYDCALFLSIDEEHAVVEWRIYDTAMGAMIQGKRQALDAYFLATDIMRILTNEPQIFLSKIAYRKRDSRKGVSSLVMTDFDGSCKKTLIESRRILVSPQWNNDQENPLLLFSEFTPTNVRLMMADMLGRTGVVLDVDGTTAGVSYAPLSDKGQSDNCVVYCHSGDIWYHHYDIKKKKSMHTRIIHEKATCSSPTLLENGDVLYCSKGSIKRYYAATKNSEIIIGNGYCVSPSYSPVAKKIAYSKKVQGLMQIFVFDMIKGTHEQVTFEDKKKGSKDFRSSKMDPCWAPDGIHLALYWERQDKQRIAILDTSTKQYEFITSEYEQCSYPAWSCNFC